jgi:hypothetical protein
VTPGADFAGGFTLRNLPIVVRLVLSVFLISVGFGYFSALVQLHFQQAAAGELLPGPGEVQDTYHGKPRKGQLERLITADEMKPFNGSGSMRSAFTFRSAGWKSQVRQLAEKKQIPPKEAEAQLRQRREYEITAILAWIYDGARQEGYNQFVLADEFFKAAPAGDEPDPRFFTKNAAGKWTAKISTILDDRCVRCHGPDKPGPEGHIHLDTWQNVADYLPAEGGGMSLMKLAQSTHVHLLGFAMLYGLTGLIFAFTSYPVWVRCAIAPLALLAQVAEISCWWLSRADPIFAYGIMGLGGIVALTVMLHIIGSLFNMYGTPGRLIIGLLLLAALGVGGLLHSLVITPHLDREKTPPSRFSPGDFTPGKEEPRPHVRLGQLERLVLADESKPFNGSGSMRPAFTVKSAGWKRQVRELAAAKKYSEAEAERYLRQLREFEINAVVSWLRGGARQEGFTEFLLPDGFFKTHPPDRPPSEEFFVAKDGKWYAKISDIFDLRCCRCHADGKGGSAGQIWLDSYQNVLDYVPPEP